MALNLYDLFEHTFLLQFDLIVNHVHTIKSEGGSDWADNLTNQPVEIGVCGPLNVQVTSADIVNGLIVNHEGTVWMLQGSVSSQDRVVGFNHSCRNLDKKNKIKKHYTFENVNCAFYNLYII